VRHTYFYKKLDEFGKDHAKLITDAVARHGQYMAQNVQLSPDAIQASASSESQPPHRVDCWIPTGER